MVYFLAELLAPVHFRLVHRQVVLFEVLPVAHQVAIGAAEHSEHHAALLLDQLERVDFDLVLLKDRSQLEEKDAARDEHASVHRLDGQIVPLVRVLLVQLLEAVIQMHDQLPPVANRLLFVKYGVAGDFV